MVGGLGNRMALICIVKSGRGEISMAALFENHELGGQRLLKNRIVMAPMTRTRTSAGDVPNALMATYYGQLASAGLIVTKATDVSAHSKGYAWTPGIYTDAQVEGWKLVTTEVHRKGGLIFLQVWHVGSMAHTSLMPGGEAPLGNRREGERVGRLRARRG
jgi:N-ethylmaleimide reductase